MHIGSDDFEINKRELFKTAFLAYEGTWLQSIREAWQSGLLDRQVIIWMPQVPVRSISRGIASAMSDMALPSLCISHTLILSLKALAAAAVMQTLNARKMNFVMLQ